MVNQNPEQIARDKIDEMLKASGWVVQSNKKINLNEGEGQAVREYQTDVGPADYVLFVDKVAVGIIEAKREEAGQNITVVEKQTNGSVSLVGKGAKISYKDQHYIYAGYLIRLRPNTELIDPDFLLYGLEYHAIRKQIEGKAKSTSRVNNINSR